MRHAVAVIGLLGRKGSGKTTVARHLVEKYGAEVVSFATPLKAMAAELVGWWPPLYYYEEVLRPNPDDELYAEVPSVNRLSWVGPGYDEALKVMTGSIEVKDTLIPALGVTPRWIMQMLGTEMCRKHLGPDVWVRAAFDAMQTSAETTGQRLFVIDDVRFPNEVEAIRNTLNVSGVVIKLTCTDDIIDAGGLIHASEDIDRIPLDQIDEAVASHRSDGSDHLLGEFGSALERLLSDPVDDHKSDVVRASHVRQALECPRLKLGA